MSRVAHTRKKETFGNPHLCENKVDPLEALIIYSNTFSCSNEFPN